MRRFITPAIIVLSLLGSTCVGQIPRYELGKRVKRFEACFESVIDDRAARKRVLPHLQAAVSSFFTLQAAESCRSLDRATLELMRENAPELAVLGLIIKPKQRLLHSSATELTISIQPMYGERPVKPHQVMLKLIAPDGATVATEVVTTSVAGARLKFQGLKDGDYTLRSKVGSFDLSETNQTISIVASLDERLGKITSAVKKFDPEQTGPVARCVRNWSLQLQSIQKAINPETDVPANELLVRMEDWSQRGQLVLDASVSRVVLTDGKKYVPCRIRLSDKALNGEPTPIVIALHGAGGSENMFYETYGAGKVVELCRKRDWLVVCPKISPLFGLSLSTDAMLSSLESQGVSINRQAVCVVGHSMGAGTTMALAKQKTKLAAVAALGGGGSSYVSTSNSSTPFFVAAGDRDFGLRAASNLAKGLQERGINVRFKSYKDTEHLGIVQIALNDVFEFFDKAMTKSAANSQ